MHTLTKNDIQMYLGASRRKTFSVHSSYYAKHKTHEMSKILADFYTMRYIENERLFPNALRHLQIKSRKNYSPNETFQ